MLNVRNHMKIQSWMTNKTPEPKDAQRAIHSFEQAVSVSRSCEGITARGHLLLWENPLGTIVQSQSREIRNRLEDHVEDKTSWAPEASSKEEWCLWWACLGYRRSKRRILVFTISLPGESFKRVLAVPSKGNVGRIVLSCQVMCCWSLERLLRSNLQLC